MKGSLLGQIALTFATLSLVAIGGANAVVPDIHRQVVGVLGWMDDPTFTTLFAIAQAAPGPNVLLVSLIGWHVAGLAGLAVATLAILIPSSLLALGMGRLVRRFAEMPWIKVAQAGLVPIAIGLILASGWVMGRAADTTPLLAVVTLGGAVFVLTSELNPLWALGGGALVSLLLHGLG